MATVGQKYGISGSLGAGWIFSGSVMAPAVDGLVAHAGGGQASATLCPAAINRFTTVATAADSALAPSAKPGMQLTVTNAGAASMNLFPASGEQINNAGANVAFALAAGKTAQLVSPASGAWHVVLSA